jgi:hypothetical protein
MKFYQVKLITTFHHDLKLCSSFIVEFLDLCYERVCIVYYTYVVMHTGGVKIILSSCDLIPTGFANLVAWRLNTYWLSQDYFME